MRATPHQKRKRKRKVVLKNKTMPQGPGTYGSQVGRPSKKKSGFKLKSGNTTPFKQMGSSPLKQDYVKDIYHEKYNPSGKIGKPEKMGTIRDVSKEISINIKYITSSIFSR